MIKSLTTTAAALALMLAIPATASAQELVNGADLDQLESMLKRHGDVTRTTDGIGDPLFQGRIDGTKYEMFLFGCNEDHKRCDEVMFKAAWATDGVSLKSLNKWNADGRYGKAYRDDENDPVLEMNVNLDNGVTTRNFNDTIAIWKRVMAQFEEEIVP
ncbi:MAG: hypothetical protein Alpg2KO_27000 [Alphaproteobacteria bacterium]